MEPKKYTGEICEDCGGNVVNEDGISFCNKCLSVFDKTPNKLGRPKDSGLSTDAILALRKRHMSYAQIGEILGYGYLTIMKRFRKEMPEEYERYRNVCRDNQSVGEVDDNS